MKVRAALYYPTPGVVPHIQTFRSVGEVKDELFCMKETAERFGEVMPFCTGYPMDSDEPLYHLTYGPNGGLVEERC